MMNVVKLTHTGIASCQHFTIGTQSSFIQQIGIQPLRLRIHSPPPCPKCVLLREWSMRVPTQCALKDVAMSVHEARKKSYTGENIEGGGHNELRPYISFR